MLSLERRGVRAETIVIVGSQKGYPVEGTESLILCCMRRLGSQRDGFKRPERKFRLHFLLLNAVQLCSATQTCLCWREGTGGPSVMDASAVTSLHGQRGVRDGSWESLLSLHVYWSGFDPARDGVEPEQDWMPL